MVLKIIVLLLGLMVATYSQEHHGHSFTLHTLVTHEVPQKISNYHYRDTEYKAAPILKRVQFQSDPEYYSPPTSKNVEQSASHGNVNEIYRQDPTKVYFTPQEPAPVYESLEPVRAPVELKIVKQTASHDNTQHRVVQVVQQIPIKPQVIHASPISPVFHQAAITPIIHQAAIAPVQHHQISHHAPTQNHIIEVAQQKPILHSVDIAHAPVHLNELQYIEANHKHSYHDESDNDHDGHHIDYYAYPKYEFAYEVKDPHTHDEKFQHESRDGDVVKGVYSFHEPDGSIRTVKYSSDKETGFNAEVSHKGHTEHIIPHHHH